jgi:tetratricopeptide (TPR) repeat protein
VAEAQGLRNAGDLAAAARILRAQLTRQPDNGDVARLLAQTLYWLKDVEGATAVYDVALARHPQDTTLRLQYGRMLADTGQRARARDVVTSLQGVPATQVEARALLGTIAYWDGDLTAAQRLFEAALRTDPTHAEAGRQLREIQEVTAPWVRVSSGVARDDQPLERVAIGVEAGWFATPLLPLTMRVEPASYRLDNSKTRRLMAAEVALAHFAPASRLDTQLAGGLLHRSDSDESPDWTGRAMLGLRLPRHLAFRVRAERTPYLYTTSSLDTPVIVHGGIALLRWDDPRGWLGEAAYHHQRFPDDNTIRTGYAWQLAPLVHRAGGDLQAGYSFTAENADESRFVLSSPEQPYPPGDPRFSMAGRYAPYYTPSRVVTHSVIAAAAVRAVSGTTLRLGGAYGFHATEDAPAFVTSPGRVDRAMASRGFSPWNVRGSLDVALSRHATLSATGEHGRSAFYEWSTAGLHLAYRFRATP